jgi:hypothetical protein
MASIYVVVENAIVRPCIIHVLSVVMHFLYTHT